MNQDLSPLFSALADPTRLAIVERLMRDGECSAGDLAGPFEISMPAISRHLKVLENAGLVERRVDRQWRRFHARPEAFAQLDDWLERHRAFWTGAFDRLEEFVAANKQEDTK